jgi:hypothetical protein
MFAVVVDWRRDAESEWRPAYVAAIRRSFQSAVNAARRVIPTEKTCIRVREIAATNFPFFLVEDDDFFALGKQQLIEFVTNEAHTRKRLGTNDYFHFNIFRVESFFSNSSDEMGAIDHFHVSDATLDALAGKIPPEKFLSKWLER